MARIPLWAADGTVRAWTLVDHADEDAVAAYRWYLSGYGYAIRGGPRPRRLAILMHRELLGLVHGDGRECDHVNGDKIDNRRANLRIATRAENMQNIPPRGVTSRYRGVRASSRCRGQWQAGVTIGGQYHYLGLFATEIEAALAAAEFRRQHMPYAVEPLLEPAREAS